MTRGYLHPPFEANIIPLMSTTKIKRIITKAPIDDGIITIRFGLPANKLSSYYK